MEEISITESSLSTMCRLCLTSGVTLLDIFVFSSKMNNIVADFIMEHAPVQITRGDKISNFICQSCYTQLEKCYQFLTQIEQSDRTLRRYIQQLYASNKPIKAESSVQPSKDPLLRNTNKDIIVKCESLEPNDVDLNWIENESGNLNQGKINNEEISLKSEIKVELTDDNLFLPTEECATTTEVVASSIDGEEFSCENSWIEIGETKVGEDMAVKREVREEKTHILTNTFIKETSLISEQMGNKNLLILTDNTSSNVDINEISCKDTKICIGEASKKSCLFSVNVTGNSSKCEETNENMSIDHEAHTHAKTFKCDACHKCFSGPSGLYYHKRTRKDKLPCNVLNVRNLIHAGEKPYQCNVCNRSFSRSDCLNSHKRVHTGDKPHQCDVCNKCFSQITHLNYHKLTHSGQKPYQCNICNKCFSLSTYLNTHMRVHTGEKPYWCHFCNKRFSQLTNLNYHKLLHTGEKPYQCDICNKRFFQSNRLNEHRRIHTGEKPYRCDVCTKCFSQSTSLKYHKRIHTREKPYQCDVCYKCFSSSSNLNKHKLIHTREKSHRCGLCNKCFYDSSGLKRHNRIHTGEKPYRCDVCNKCFSQSPYLNKHKRIHTDEKPYQCDLCNKCFSQSSNLNEHKLAIHMLTPQVDNLKEEHVLSQN